MAVAKHGGKYQEGIVGQPRYLNPVLAQVNDADRDLVQLVFSGLLRYDHQGQLINDLAEKYIISEEGLTYDLFLRQDAFWHDGQAVTADDVLFTIQTIQNSEYNSPLKISWQGVSVEKIDQWSLRFSLRNSYAPFLNNLTVAILPKHLWQNVSPQGFALNDRNIVNPIGSGPYKIKKTNINQDGQINSIDLIWNENFYRAAEASKPYIEKITIKFYQSEIEAIAAYNIKEVDGLNFISATNLDQINLAKTQLHQIQMPRYYAVFFNQTQSKALADKNVRLALNQATNKELILDQVLKNKGQIVHSPVLPSSLGFNPEITKYNFSLTEATATLDKAGWLKSEEDNIRQKKINNEIVRLEINFITVNWPELAEVATLIKNDWQQIGVAVNLELIDPFIIEHEYIRPRQYQALLFGEVLGADPDPFAFWHSSLKKDPGLNLALYSNSKADKLLEEGRQTIDQDLRAEKYTQFQEIISQDIPAIFLYNPAYLYPVNQNLKGVKLETLPLPSHRFSQIENWYLKTKRVKP